MSHCLQLKYLILKRNHWNVLLIAVVAGGPGGGHFHPPRGHWACDLPTFALDDYQAALVGPPPACPMFMTLSLSSCRKPAECIANADAA